VDTEIQDPADFAQNISIAISRRKAFEMAAKLGLGSATLAGGLGSGMAGNPPEAGGPKPETAALLNLYDRRLLNNLTRLYNLLERMQASRLGKPMLPTVPVDVTITHDGDGEG
jgi:hypothetical protein